MRTKILALCFVFSNSFANECLSENDINIQIHNHKTSEDEDLSDIKISKKNSNKILFFEEFLGYKNLNKDISFIDMDFDGIKDIVITSDSDPDHSVNYMALKVDCNKIERHPLLGEFGEFKGYNIVSKEKKTIIYLDKSHNITTLEYCYKEKIYLCKESYFIEDGIELIRKYDYKGKLLMADIYSGNKKLDAIVNRKTFLNKEPNIQTSIYLIKGDKVNILEKQIDADNQKWYFINYKGKKDINMWIKAEAVDVTK